ncbi:putative carboxypeptidase C [Lupinus albus]|uniref:Carboxypeptidase n=1 Tax=Lupinus albus TaxID=3870 RepID=A0A6A4NR24_LUPAL|nr:putative carboxypeptidase C [Lupinus albus]
MASLSLIKISFALSLFFFLLPSSSSSRLSFTTIKNHHQSLTTNYAKSETERLIRSFNLFPEDLVNIIDNEPGFTPGSLVEKKFSFLGASGPSVEDLGHHAGYYSLPHSKAARMFYFFFESRTNKDDPVVIWLSGGPGCSSSIALFYENGPFKIAKNFSLVWNDYGWDKASNILFIDQPTGTGFSYTSDETDIRSDEAGVSNDLYDFLQAFFKEHPQFSKNEFYITGESYAGHYIPALASRVHKGNNAKEGIPINLKGFAIGNGLTNPGVQYPAYTDYALDKGLITKGDQDSINKLIPDCKRATQSCGMTHMSPFLNLFIQLNTILLLSFVLFTGNLVLYLSETNGGESCEDARYACQSIFESILAITGNINVRNHNIKYMYFLTTSPTSVNLVF